MNRDAVIESLLDRYQAKLQDMDNEELLGDDLEKVREAVIERLLEQRREELEHETKWKLDQRQDELEDETNEDLLGDRLDRLREEAIEHRMDVYRSNLDRMSDEELGKACQ